MCVIAMDPGTIEVSMGEVKVLHSPAILRTNLGSCVGVVLYDPVEKCGGIAHIVSPESIQELGKVSTSYADIAIPTLLDLMNEQGCTRGNLVCSIGGGGCMFGGLSGFMDIGKKNIESVKRILHSEHIRIKKEEVGGLYSTVILLDVSDGAVTFERKESNLKIVIQKEKDYKKQWIEQNTDILVHLERFIRSKKEEYVSSSTGKIDSQKLRGLVRQFSRVHKVSRLIGYVAYTNVMTELQKK